MRTDLEHRIAALAEEIRRYPTPIARCDEHLGALLEERARLLAQLGGLKEIERCSALALWINDGGFHAA